MKRMVWVVIICGAIVFVVAAMAVAANNRFVGFEAQLKAQQEQTQNVYSTISNDIRSQGLVVEQYRKSVLQAIDSAMTGRYGKDGLQGAFVAIREQNPQMSEAVFLKLQSVISSGYAQFEKSQAIKLDILRAYETQLNSFPDSVFAGLLGYPKLDLSKMGTIVISQETEDVFSSGKSNPIDPFANQK